MKNPLSEIRLGSVLDKLTGDFLISVERWPSHALVVPRIQAHRGYWKGGAQENTLAAFRQARERGLLMFECDVRLSRDQIPVVFHDEDLNRLGQQDLKVSELTSLELKERVNAPTLEEVLSDPQVPRLANIELKSKILIDDSLERRVAHVVRKCKAESRVLFSSFNPMSLLRISLHCPQIPRALLATNESDPENSFILKRFLAAPFFSFHLLHLDHRDLTPAKMEFWRKRRIPIAVWTVNGKDDIQRFLKMGAMSVISDDGGL